MISFIIPAYNEAEYLGDTLDAVHEAMRGIELPYEVVVANDASTDDTAQLAASRGARVVDVAYRQIAATRNAGARAARGQYFVFIDADTRVNQALLLAMLEALRRGAVGGGAHSLFDSAPLYGRLLLAFVMMTLRWANWAAGCFLYCTREAYEAAHGFDEAYFGAEEVSLSRGLKQQGRFVILKQAVVTSGRKLRQYSGWQFFKLSMRLLSRGPNAVKHREGMGFWYEQRQGAPAERAASDRPPAAPR